MNTQTQKNWNKAAGVVQMIYPPVLLIGALLVLWQLLCTIKEIPVWMLAKPTDIAAIFLENTKEMLPHIGLTYSNILIGLLLAILIGFFLAILIASSKTLGSAITPFIVAMCCIPMITLVPMLMLVFGVGRSVKIITIVIQAFPLMNMNAVTAFINVDPTKMELMKSLKATRFQQFRYCILQDSLPGLFTGIKLASIMSMLAGVTAEMTGGNTGLGSRISYLIGFSKTPQALSSLIYIIILGIVLYGGISLLEKKFVKNT
ncbi:MAG: ABC transporter permease [Lachnospiraceae bacterium]